MGGTWRVDTHHGQQKSRRVIKQPSGKDNTMNDLISKTVLVIVYATMMCLLVSIIALDVEWYHMLPIGFFFSRIISEIIEIIKL